MRWATHSHMNDRIMLIYANNVKYATRLWSENSNAYVILGRIEHIWYHAERIALSVRELRTQD